MIYWSDCRAEELWPSQTRRYGELINCLELDLNQWVMVVPPIVAAAVARIFFYADLQRWPRVQATIIYNASSRSALMPAVGIGIGTGVMVFTLRKIAI